MYHSFLIHSSADGHLGCFHDLAIINYKQCCDGHWGTRVFFNSGFLGVYAQQWDCWVIWQFYLQFFKESPKKISIMDMQLLYFCKSVVLSLSWNKDPSDKNYKSCPQKNAFMPTHTHLCTQLTGSLELFF